MLGRSFALLFSAALALGGCEEFGPGAPPDSDLDAASSPDAAAPPDDASALPEPSSDAQADSAADSLDAQLGDASDAADSAPDTGAREFPVGTARIEIAARDGRALPVQLWYPAAESARAEASAGHPASELEPPGPRRALLERLLASAPEACATRRMHAAFDAPPDLAAAPYPLLVSSHHLEGMRIAVFSIAEALAKKGFVVAAPDHTSMTLYDRTDDLQTADLLATGLRFRLDGLALRAADVEDVIGALLVRDAAAVPAGLRGKLDPERVGVFGHSMGSMTSGMVAARDARVKAAAYLSFPPAAMFTLLNILEQPAIETFRVPALFMLNQEDAPVSAAGGNDAIREQFAAHAPLAYLVEVRDTGHWSFADSCALIPDFADGCGQGTRQVEPYEPYQNLDAALARQIAARNVAAFFGSQFLGESTASFSASAPSPYEVASSHPTRMQSARVGALD